MKVGDRVRHYRLGDGVLYMKCKHGWLVNFSNRDGILVRGSKEEDLELLDE